MTSEDITGPIYYIKVSKVTYLEAYKYSTWQSRSINISRVTIYPFIKIVLERIENIFHSCKPLHIQAFADWHIIIEFQSGIEKSF